MIASDLHYIAPELTDGGPSYQQILKNGDSEANLKKAQQLTFEENVKINAKLSALSSGNLKKSNPSKMYPILKDMEGNGLIAGDDVLRDNKKVKFYKITEKGEFLLNHVCNNFNDIRKSPKGSLFFDDFLNF